MASKRSEWVTLTKVVNDYTEFCLLEFHVRNWLETHVGEWIKNQQAMPASDVDNEYQAMGGTFMDERVNYRSLTVGSGWKLINSYFRVITECRCEMILQLQWSPDVLQLKLKYF
jgi:hypothetical protein